MADRSEDSDQRFEIFKRNLQAAYKRDFAHIPSLSWKNERRLALDDVFVERQGQVMIKEQSGWKKHGQMIDVDAVSLIALSFHYQKFSKSVITVEGKMGSGKTTMCKRILRDWACEDLDIMEGLCLLHVNANEKNNTVKEISKLIELPNNVDKRGLSKLLAEKQEEILLFIDVNKSQNSYEWLNNICNRLLPKAKCIIFCRPDVSSRLLDINAVKVFLQDFNDKQMNELFGKLLLDYYLQDELFDAMSENEYLRRLCGNPFTCTAIALTCKEHGGVEFTDNSLLFVRTIIGCIWKRFTCESRVSHSTSLNDLDVLMTSLSGPLIKIFDKGGQLRENDIQSMEHGSLLLESGLLYQETYIPKLTPNGMYRFFDPIVNEYACALNFSKTLLKRPEERVYIGAMLCRRKWHHTCRLTAGSLQDQANIIIEQLLAEKCDADRLKLLCECVFESGSSNVSKVLDYQLNDVRKLLGNIVDFSSVDINSSTIKGLTNIILQLQGDRSPNTSFKNRSSSFRCSRLYKSVDNILNSRDLQTECSCHLKRYDSQFPCKQCSSLQLMTNRLSRSNILMGIEEKLQRCTSARNKTFQNTSNRYSTSLFELSRCSSSVNLRYPSSNNIARKNSTSNLNRFKNSFHLNDSKKESFILDELDLKGSNITNKLMVDVIKLVNVCKLKRLYMMSAADVSDECKPIGNKLVNSFESCIIDNMTDISLNDHHLGANWMMRLCKIIKEDSMLITIKLSVSCIHELSVESAMNLVKAMKNNVVLEAVELYCGIQPMVIMTLFSFYKEILAKDDRLHLVFL